MIGANILAADIATGVVISILLLAFWDWSEMDKQEREVKMDSEIELKPCPFCGGKARIAIWQAERPPRDLFDQPAETYCVECANPDCEVQPLMQTDCRTKELAAQVWNRRA